MCAGYTRTLTACVQDCVYTHTYLSVVALLVNLIFFVFIYVFSKISIVVRYFIISQRYITLEGKHKPELAHGSHKTVL